MEIPGGSFIDCMLYLSFFPKVISGPIVLWKDFAPMLEKRVVTSEGVVFGLNRVMIGFAKKLILADQFGHWHISLGRWFREYIYFSLGGSRRGERRAICNVAVVFAVTGIWHGAGWNYLLWGGINGAMVIAVLFMINSTYSPFIYFQY